MITNIGFDHEKYLGKTKEQIAREKAGIIKNNQIVVTAEQDKKLIDYFRKVCKQKNSTLVPVSEVISAKLLTLTLDNQKFSTRGIISETFTLPLLGEHQIKNALTAITTAHELKKIGKKISLDSLKKGISSTHLQGRTQVISKKPLIIVDGAHNVEGMSALKDFITHFRKRKVVVIGISEDKPSKEMLKTIVPLFERVIVTEGRFKPKNAEILGQEVKEYNSQVLVLKNPKQAIKKALSFINEDEMMLITGSLYLVSDALKELKEVFETQQ